MEKAERLSKARLVLGAIVFISGFLSPLLVPWVSQFDWPTGIKATLSGLLLFGIPELFMIIAVAICGKRGLSFLKNLLFRFLRSFLSTNVSKTQYYFGLLMFSLPLFVGILYPYLGDHFHLKQPMIIAISISLDVIMLLGIFVAGEHFWKKLYVLFTYNEKSND